MSCNDRLDLKMEEFCVITFLKRMIVLESKLKLVMYARPKHVDKLFELMGAKKIWKPKCAGSDEKPKTWSSVQRYRSAVGILLYLSCDMVQG